MLKKWINGWLDDAPSTQALPTQSKLNLKKTLVALDTLKAQLEHEVAQRNNANLNPEELEKNDVCDYGKWLNSIGKAKYADTKEFKNALEAHTFYRQIAADVIYMHQAGKTKKARDILKTGFKEASNLNQIELVRLYNMTIR